MIVDAHRALLGGVGRIRPRICERATRGRSVLSILRVSPVMETVGVEGTVVDEIASVEYISLSVRLCCVSTRRLPRRRCLRAGGLSRRSRADLGRRLALPDA
jgi:hypothetical protein